MIRPSTRLISGWKQVDGVPCLFQDPQRAIDLFVGVVGGDREANSTGRGGTVGGGWPGA